jgi:hypothetical protein
MARKATSTQKEKAVPKKSGSTRKKTTPAPAPSPKQKRPIFSMGTWAAVILLIGLIGATIYINRQKETKAAETTPTTLAANLFGPEDGKVTSIEIKPAEGEPAKVVRNAENVWVLELPEQAEANQEMAEAASTQIAALQVIAPVEGDPSIFGFDAPVYAITVEFDNGKTHTFEVGDNTPTYSGYYVRLDKGKMMIVSLNGIDSLLNLVNFPPYLNTPTPTALPPTEAPAVSTPESTVTPAP